MARDDRFSPRCTYIPVPTMLSSRSRTIHPWHKPPSRTKSPEDRVFFSGRLFSGPGRCCSSPSRPEIRHNPDKNPIDVPGQKTRKDKSPRRTDGSVCGLLFQGEGLYALWCTYILVHCASCAAVCMLDRFRPWLPRPRRRRSFLLVVVFIVVWCRHHLLLRHGTRRRVAGQRVLPSSRPRLPPAAAVVPATASGRRRRLDPAEIFRQHLLCRLCLERGGADKMRRLDVHGKSLLYRRAFGLFSQSYCTAIGMILSICPSLCPSVNFLNNISYSKSVWTSE